MMHEDSYTQYRWDDYVTHILQNKQINIIRNIRDNSNEY